MVWIVQDWIGGKVMVLVYGPQKKTLECIWQDFVDGKIDQNPGIRNEVFDSWLRSREWGIDPYMERASITLSGSALAEELERKREFLSAATPVIKDLYSVVKGSGFAVWVSNGKGIILEGIADPDANELCENDNLVVGSDWSEEKVGNNAIGTALYLKRPVQFVRAEHYRKKAHRGCCSAAPIIGPSGEIMGVLDMTGFWNKAHTHTLGMMVAGVGAIQREMRLRSSHQYIMEMIESLPSGIIVVNQEGIVTNINRKASEMLKSSVETFLHQNIYETLSQVDCIKKALESGKETEEREYRFENKTQMLHFTSACRPIVNRMGVLDGAVVVLREIEAVYRITRKMAGYKARFTFNDIIGEDPLFKDVINHAKIAASTSLNILILGESGTGKEVVAQSIHNASPLRYGPFIAVNCGALPRELIGSELFGYEEGAFTGAKKGGSPGKFELANNGTLFLDEIGDMPLELQVMLLRVIEERVITRLGGHRELPVNVRLITATNKNMRRLLSKGLFRQDLYYRLNVVSLQIPPLRQKKGDIAILANYIIKTHSKKVGKEVVALSPHALSELENYSWPGNIRELENVIERALVFSSGSALQIDSLSTLIDSEKISDDLLIQKQETKLPHKCGEKDLIINTLTGCDGNISKASHILGITRATLYRRLRDYDIKKNINPYQI